MTDFRFQLMRRMIEFRLWFAVEFYFLGQYLAPTRIMRLRSSQAHRRMTDFRWATRIFFGYPPDSPEFSRMFYTIDEFAMTDARWKPLVKEAARVMGIERD